jgi:hypothetical protein
MPVKQGQYLGGIRSVEDIRQRCRVDDDTGCWHWGMAKDKAGYGRVYFVLGEERMYTSSVRRAALTLKGGEKLPKWAVAFAKQHCHTRDCGNPDHARASTWANHGQFMTSRGVHKHRHIPPARVEQERQRLAKITWDDVRAIRASTESNGALSERFGVGKSHISDIKHHRYWKENLSHASVFTFRPTMKEAA